jgi:ABC-type glycerol-3-phosphate transport system substrate-binding protein
MKNKMKFFGIIALVAVIGFSACSNGSTGGGGKSSGGGGGSTTTDSSITYTGKSADGSSYSLKITENNGRAAYTPKKGDSYELTVSGKKAPAQ